jgi:hypothetical protein
MNTTTVTFTPEEADVVADALQVYMQNRIRDQLRSDATDEEKAMDSRLWKRASRALDKVREA